MLGDDLLENEFNFILTENGYKQAMKEKREVMRNIKKNKVAQNNSKVVLVELIAIVIVYYCLSGFDLSRTCIYIVLLVITLFLLYKSAMKINIYYLKQKNYINGNIHFIINEKFIKTELKYHSVEYKWSFIKDTIITSNYIFLVTFEDKVMFVPRNLFENYNEFKKFYGFVKENIDNLSNENLIRD